MKRCPVSGHECHTPYTCSGGCKASHLIQANSDGSNPGAGAIDALRIAAWLARDFVPLAFWITVSVVGVACAALAAGYFFN